MFEKLFTRPGALRRHREGPLATERAEYLSTLAAQGMARGTILRRSSFCLCVAVELQRGRPTGASTQTKWRSSRRDGPQSASPVGGHRAHGRPRGTSSSLPWTFYVASVD